MKEPGYGLLPDVKYLAVQVPKRDGFQWRWFKKGPSRFSEPGPLPPGCVETIYKASGETIAREDGELAEIYQEHVADKADK